MSSSLPANKPAALSPADLTLLKPPLDAADLPLRHQLERRNQRVEHVYFMDGGIASTVMSGGANHMVEVGIVGKEGMTGLATALITGTATYESRLQIDGTDARHDN